jgi:hypothetical protein
MPQRINAYWGIMAKYFFLENEYKKNPGPEKGHFSSSSGRRIRARVKLLR